VATSKSTSKSKKSTTSPKTKDSTTLFSESLDSSIGWGWPSSGDDKSSDSSNGSGYSPSGWSK